MRACARERRLPNHLTFRFTPSHELTALASGDQWCSHPGELSAFEVAVLACLRMARSARARTATSNKRSSVPKKPHQCPATLHGATAGLELRFGVVSSDDRSGANDKPNHASVTTVRCTCDYLQRAAAEPFSPIVFDAEVNEFDIAHTTPAGVECRARIYHCPWCGGAAPRSLRGPLFAQITSHESTRLQDLCESLPSVEAAIAKLGPPDSDLATGFTTETPASDTKPATSVSYRVLVYTALSDTADVRLTDFGPDHGLRCSLDGKYLGARKT